MIWEAFKWWTIVVQVVEGIWPKIAHSAAERSPPCHCHPASNLSAKIGTVVGGFWPDNSKVPRYLLYTLWARERERETESTTTTTKQSILMRYGRCGKVSDD